MEGILIKSIKIIIAIIISTFLFQISSLAVTDTAASSVVINADTFEILYQNDAFTKRSMASTTKIMTALLLAESGRLDEIICCTADMVTVEGSSMGLKAGDYISARDLLYGILLMSGNDAANVCAHFLAGSTEGFAILMNSKAAELGLASTNFVTPSGLDAESHYTTAYDLAVLTAYALKNEEFAKACSSYTATVQFGDPMVKYTITNHNRLLKTYDGCIGVKTGFTKKSGRCLVTAARRDTATVIAVTLNDPNDWRDHRSLLDYGFAQLDERLFLSETDLKIAVIGGEKKTIGVSFDKIKINCLDKNKENFDIQVSLPEYLFAPIKKGDVVGRVSIVFNGLTVTEHNIYAEEDIFCKKQTEKSFSDKIIEFIILMLKSF